MRYEIWPFFFTKILVCFNLESDLVQALICIFWKQRKRQNPNMGVVYTFLCWVSLPPPHPSPLWLLYHKIGPKTTRRWSYATLKNSFEKSPLIQSRSSFALLVFYKKKKKVILWCLNLISICVKLAFDF